MKYYDLAEIGKHSTPKDCWVVVNNIVYDVSKFLDSHPGGKKVIVHFAGRDISEEFASIHKDSTEHVFLKPFKIGELYPTPHKSKL